LAEPQSPIRGSRPRTAGPRFAPNGQSPPARHAFSLSAPLPVSPKAAAPRSRFVPAPAGERALQPPRPAANARPSRRPTVPRKKTTPVAVRLGSSDQILQDPRANAELQDATGAYVADRYQDALRILRKLAEQFPGSAGIKELLGLTLYRLGRWTAALRELERHHELSGSYDQYPVMADSYRALRRYREAEELWAELRQVSPSAEVMAEGRLVAAGALADQGDLQGAVKLLESSLRRAKPKSLHLRQWYALADLYERAGELPRARDLFRRVAAADPDAYDVRQRLVALR